MVSRMMLAASGVAETGVFPVEVLYLPLDGFGLRSAAAGIERIGGDVKNRHHLRRGKINVHGLHG